MTRCPLNLVLPGAAFFRIGRPFLGAIFMGIFGLGVHVMIAAAFVAPSAWPRWMLAGGFLLSCLTWIAAQLAAAGRTGQRGSPPVTS